jgi:hypothetical protein
MTTGVTDALSVRFAVSVRYSSEHSRNCPAGFAAGAGIPLGWSGRGGAGGGGWEAVVAVGAGGGAGGSASAAADARGEAVAVAVSVCEGVGVTGALEGVVDVLAETVGEDSPAVWGTGSPLVHDASNSTAVHQTAAWP